MVLLDAGHSVGDKLPSDVLDTADMSKLSGCISIVTELSDTLAYGDRVTVITFTSSGAKIVLPTVSNSDCTLHLFSASHKIEKPLINVPKGSF